MLIQAWLLRLMAVHMARLDRCEESFVPERLSWHASLYHGVTTSQYDRRQMFDEECVFHFSLVIYLDEPKHAVLALALLEGYD